MATVAIPAKQARTFPTMPSGRSRDGHSLIQGMVRRTLESLPSEEAVIDPDSMPSVSRVYPGLEKIKTVISVLGDEALQCPESLLTLKWEIREHSEGVSAAAFDEDGVARACSMPHVFIQTMLKTQLRTDDVEEEILGPVEDVKLEPWERPEEGEEKPELRLLATLGLEVNEGRRHKTDVALVNAGLCYGFFGYKTSLSAGHDWWDLFPFTSSDIAYYAVGQLASPIQKMISQCVFYADCVIKKRKLPVRRILVALATPPTRLHYLLIDFDRETVVVTQNVVRLEQTEALHPDQRAHLVLQLVDPGAMTVYWRQVLWFQLVSTYSAFPSLLTDALRADTLRPHNERRVPSDVLEKLRNVHRLLGEVPSPSSWVGFQLWKSRLTCSVIGAFGDIVCNLWMKLTWGFLGTRMMLRRSQRVQIQGQETLVIDNETGRRRWWAAALDNGVRWENEDGDKEFILYRHHRIFVKICDSSCLSEFEAEVELYNRFTGLQGSGIPWLHASGTVLESDNRRFLIVSYEGEPLKQWNDHNRGCVKKIAKLLHAANFHHHDIEPRNVVVDEAGKVTLIDFGLSTQGCTNAQCTEESWAADNLGLVGSVSPQTRLSEADVSLG